MASIAVAAFATATALVGPTVATASAASPHRPTELAELLQPIRALSSPLVRSTSVRYLAQFTPLTGEPAMLPIVERRTVADREWLRVMLPGRPNNRTGWIPANMTTSHPLVWRIRIDLSNRVLVAFKAGDLIKRFKVVIGARITPTPLGNFFVVEKVRLGTKWSPRGWALALSAFSNALRHFEGGQGQVAIHARGSLAGALGSASSHGCIRVTDRDAGWLNTHVPRGTFVEIVR